MDEQPSKLPDETSGFPPVATFSGYDNFFLKF